jgi:glycosyltransferase involved in cell wall biosynthesis
LTADGSGLYHHPMQRVGLVMIVKNEAHVLRRCLESARPLIHHFTIILDEHTTDDSAEVITKTLVGLPGVIEVASWKGMSATRNQANELARLPYPKLDRSTLTNDYLLTIDADDYLELPIGYQLPQLTADGYAISVYDSVTVYQRLMLFKAASAVHYEGAAYERLVGAATTECLPGPRYIRTHDGASWVDKLGKAERDAELLEEDLRRNPNDTNACFYGAQCWRDVADWAPHPSESVPALRRAIELYQRRTTMGGGEVEEVFYSYFMLGKLLGRLGERRSSHKAYVQAIDANPARAAEPRHDLVVSYRETSLYAAAYEIGKPSLHDPLPVGLMVDTSIYRWRLKLEWAAAAWWAGHRDVARAMWAELVDVVPLEEREALRKNLLIY